MRSSKAKDGFTMSDHGNFIMDASFQHVKDIKKLNNDLNNIVGIVETSLFVGLVTSVISVDDAHVRVIK